MYGLTEVSGSVIVDLAAEAGGNVAVTKPGQLSVHKGVTIIGYTDLPSRLPTQSSTLYSNNVTKFLLSMTPADAAPKTFGINLDDEVIRRSIVLHKGQLLWPAPAPPAPAAAPTPAATTAAGTAIAAEAEKAVTPWQKVTREVAAVTAGMAGVVALGKATAPAFMGSFYTFGLAGLIGYRAVWGVAPALHSPLMSVTNAVSGTYIIHHHSLYLIYFFGTFRSYWCWRVVCDGRWLSTSRMFWSCWDFAGPHPR